jgi:hypothetical protein
MSRPIHRSGQNTKELLENPDEELVEILAVRVDGFLVTSGE